MLESLGVIPTTQWLPPKILKIRFRHAMWGPGGYPRFDPHTEATWYGYCGQDPWCHDLRRRLCATLCRLHPACTLAKPIRLKRRMEESLDQRNPNGMS